MQLALRPMDLHVWHCRLDLADRQVAALASLLSVDEQARAERIRVAAGRRAFIVARARLRFILGRYLDVTPGKIRFTYNRFGKPFLKTDKSPNFDSAPCSIAQEDKIQFSVAHSGNVAVYALARQRVGIDVESFRPHVDFLGIARRFFASSEQQTLMALPTTLQSEAFLHCWTRKEAYAKACGMGLYLPFEQFEVSCRPGEPAELLAVAADAPLAATGPKAWRFWELPLEAGYVGVVVVENPTCEIGWWQLSESGVDQD